MTDDGPLIRDVSDTARWMAAYRAQETERDEQWVVTIPERFSETAYDTMTDFVAFTAQCMGAETSDE